MVTGTCNVVNTNPANLTVNPTTNITTQPSSITRCENESAGFSVVASGSGNTFQWKKDGVDLIDNANISGANTANLTIASVSTADAGAYTCQVNSESSIVAVLTINELINITSQPAAKERCANDNVVFHVVASGTSPTYQWQKDGVNLVDGGTISGVTSSALSISNVDVADVGNYRCIVTGSCGTVNSDPAALTVNTNTVITTQPTGSTICKGASHTFSVAANGSNLTYKWKKDGIALTDGGAITGSSTSNLVVSAADLSDAGAYTCEVTGTCGIENSDIAILVVEETTQITLQPVDATGCLLDNISFSIVAKGQALSYQWQKNGANISNGGSISGANTPNLTLSGILPSDEGSYVCVVSGNCGSLNSDPAYLTSGMFTFIMDQPTDKTICAGQSASLSVTADGDNLSYQWKKGGVSLSDGGRITGTNTTTLNIANAVLTDEGSYTCEVTGSCGTAISNIAFVEVRATTSITQQPVDITGCNGDNVNFAVVADGHNLTYQWQKDGVNMADGGSISGANSNFLSISGIVPADAASYRCVVSGTCNTIISNPATLSSYTNTAIITQPIGTTICENSPVSLSVTAVGDNLSYQWFNNGDSLSDGGNISGASSSNLNITQGKLVNIGTYTVTVNGECGSENSNLANIQIDTATVIQTQPNDVNGCQGDVINFSVNAIGTSLGYQWQKDGVNLTNGGTISGATSSLLQINGIVPADNGTYRCIVTGNCGTVNSNTASLNSYSITSITTQPTDKTVCEGDQITLTTAANGDNLTYQWKRNGVVLSDGGTISGSNSNSLLISSAASTDIGIYNCVITGACGTENSDPSNVVVNIATNISLQPQNLTKCEGDVAVFSVSADGENLSYLWQKDGAPLSDGGDIFGSATNTLTLTNLTSSESGTYRCVITGTCGNVNSNGASLIVNVYPNAAGTIIGPSNVCQGDNGVIYEIAAINNADYYQWNLPVGAYITSGDSTRLISVNFADNELGGNFTVQGINGCGAGTISPTLLVTANVIPEALAGSDQNICADNSAFTAIHPGSATGSWSVLDGPATIQSPNLNTSTVTNLRSGTNEFIWTVSKNGCSSTDTVVIKNNEVTVEAGTDVTICTETITLSANTPQTGATGLWSVISGAANFDQGNLPNSQAGAFGTGLNILKWTITNGNCSDYDTIIVDNQAPSTSYAGINQSICADSSVLMADNPSIGTGTWSVITGSATFADENSATSKITNVALGTNILRWTINNGICSSIDEVSIINNNVSLNAGLDQVICDRTTDLAADEPNIGVGNWSVVSGSATFVNNNLYNTRVTNLAKGDNVLAWNINNNGCLSTDLVTITNDAPSNSNAGTDQTLTTDITTLQGNIPTVGTGTWSLISGSANIVNPSLYNTTVNSLGLGENTFHWTITNNSCLSSDDVVVNNFTPTNTDAGPDQTICSDNTSMAGNEPSFGFGEWSVVKGSATFTDASKFNTTVTGLAPGDNILRWTIWQNGYTSDDVVITNNSATQSNAGGDQTICKDNTTLAANNPLIGSGKWTVISGAGTFGNDTLFNTTVTGLTKGENIFKWTITHHSCSSNDVVTIQNDLPTIPEAGIDQTLCENTAILSPNTPSIGTGAWSVIGGAASFDGNSVSNLASGSNTLRWTITNNLCSLYDEVLIVNNKPSTADAGADKVVCSDSVTLLANSPTIGVGTWTIQNGSANIADTNSATSFVSDLASGINVLRWTVENSGCSNYDELVITNSLIVAEAGTSQEICSNTTILEANNPENGTGQWSILGGSGSAMFDNLYKPDTRVSQLDKGDNILRWTVVNGICESYSDVTITNNLPTQAFAGPDIAICLDSTGLQGNTPLIGTGEWSILSGSAIIKNNNIGTSTVTQLNFGVNTLQWTITNKGCTSTDEVTISNNATIKSDAGPDIVICSDSTTLYGNNPPFGTGQWSVISGSANFENNNIYNTKVQDLGDGINILRWLISNGICSSSDDVIVTNNSPSTAIAGADNTICGDSTNLLANNPEIGIGTWELISGSANFANPGAFNTKVSKLNPGENTLRWKIEHEGCYSYDDVTITNDLPFVADAGQDMELCDANTVLFANEPMSGSGVWSIISGSGSLQTPTLYNTPVSNLGFGSNTLRWTITYDKCVTYDEIKVVNNQLDIYAGIDQTIGQPETFLAANAPSVGSGSWSVVGGYGTFADPTSSTTTVTEIGPGLNTFRWSVDINGCISFDDVSVTYNVPPGASFVVTKTEGCPPLEMYFVNNSMDGLPFTWDFGDGTTSTDVTLKHTYTESGVYTASLTIFGEKGEVIKTDTTITVHDVPDISFLIVNKEVYIPEEEALFINQSTNGARYLWEFGDGGTSSEKEPRYVYETPGNYDITLHVWTENECYDTVIQPAGVEVYESGGINFPNAFTPNPEGSSDGLYNENDFSNDVFFPIGEGVDEYRLEIFNKWGMLIFESNDINVGWDGYYEGKLLDKGVYVWKVTGTYNNGKSFKKVGTVLLIR
ncbi:MAG: immunoglobulin domain-containing protein [Bacteroidales bacterium]|nr:immunoglobulin domain-containing protein [Bacteroidales bacterium]